MAVHTNGPMEEMTVSAGTRKQLRYLRCHILLQLENNYWALSVMIYGLYSAR